MNVVETGELHPKCQMDQQQCINNNNANKNNTNFLGESFQSQFAVTAKCKLHPTTSSAWLCTFQIRTNLQDPQWRQSRMWSPPRKWKKLSTKKARTEVK